MTMQMNRRRGHTHSALADINITPFVDVVLVLLIIFMITAPVLQSGIEVELPRTKTVQVISEERLVVTVDRGQRVYLNDNPVNLNKLGGLLQAKSEFASRGVYIRCDESVPFGVFATVMDTIRQAGIENVSVVTRPLRQKKK